MLLFQTRKNYFDTHLDVACDSPDPVRYIRYITCNLGLKRRNITNITAVVKRAVIKALKTSSTKERKSEGSKIFF